MGHWSWHPLCGPCDCYAIAKTIMIGLPRVEESIMLSRFDTIPECDRQRDGDRDCCGDMLL